MSSLVVYLLAFEFQTVADVAVAVVAVVVAAVVVVVADVVVAALAAAVLLTCQYRLKMVLAALAVVRMSAVILTIA